MLIIKIGADRSKKVKVEDYKYNEMVNLKGDDISGIPQYLTSDIFGNKYRINIIDWNDEERRKILYNFLPEIKDSDNIFVIDEEDILDATFKKLSSHASHVYDYREVKLKENPFNLAELIVRKKKREAWIEYMRLLDKNEAIESIIGVINWKLNQVRNVEGSYKMLKFIADDHDSKGDAKKELEKFILNL